MINQNAQVGIRPPNQVLQLTGGATRPFQVDSSLSPAGSQALSLGQRTRPRSGEILVLWCLSFKKSPSVSSTLMDAIGSSRHRLSLVEAGRRMLIVAFVGFLSFCLTA